MQRSPTPDNGIFMVNLTNVVLFVIVALFLGGYGRLLPLTVAAFFLFVLAGVLTTFAGRYFHYAAIRLIGPSRATAIRVSSPVVTATLAFMFLGERLSMAQYLGAAAVLAGVALLAREASKRECLEVSAFREGEQGDASGPTKARRSRYLGSLFAIASAAAFGSGHFVRKVALFSVPSPWWGMLIGSVVGWLCVLIWAGCAAKLIHIFPGSKRTNTTLEGNHAAKQDQTGAEKYGVHTCYLFGSQAGGQARPDSDVDLAVLFPAMIRSETTWTSC